MSDGSLMWLGFITTLVALMMNLAEATAMSSLLAMGGGAVFGKGYGRWEIRAAILAEEEKR